MLRLNASRCPDVPCRKDDRLAVARSGLQRPGRHAARVDPGDLELDARQIGPDAHAVTPGRLDDRDTHAGQPLRYRLIGERAPLRVARRAGHHHPGPDLLTTVAGALLDLLVRPRRVLPQPPGLQRGEELLVEVAPDHRTAPSARSRAGLRCSRPSCRAPRSTPPRGTRRRRSLDRTTSGTAAGGRAPPEPITTTRLSAPSAATASPIARPSPSQRPSEGNGGGEHVHDDRHDRHVHAVEQVLDRV